jgi:hypothetical protein
MASGTVTLNEQAEQVAVTSKLKADGGKATSQQDGTREGGIGPKATAKLLMAPNVVTRNQYNQNPNAHSLSSGVEASKRKPHGNSANSTEA